MTYERQSWSSCGCSFCRGIRSIETKVSAVSSDPEATGSAPPEEAQPEALAPGLDEEAL